MDHQRRVAQHTWAGNSPDAWKSCAGDLLAAAVVLGDRRMSTDEWRLHPSELMLRGMAVECLLKAVWVNRGNKLAEDGAFFKVPGAGSHNLVQLAGVIALSLSNEEKDVLIRLSHFIEYGGRYPIPKEAGKLALIPSPRGGRASPTHWVTPSDQQLFDAVVGRLEQLLDGSA